MSFPIENLTSDRLQKLETFVNAEENPIIYLAIDPGKTNGVCGYDEKFYLQFTYAIAAQDMVSFLAIFKHVQKCIIEDFKLYPNKARKQIYSDMETSRIIGRTESWAEHNKIEIIKQPASVKPTGYAWLGQKPLPKSNNANHPQDAHVHFVYWAIRNGHMDPKVLLKGN